MWKGSATRSALSSDASALPNSSSRRPTRTTRSRMSAARPRGLERRGPRLVRGHKPARRCRPRRRERHGRGRQAADRGRRRHRARPSRPAVEQIVSSAAAEIVAAPITEKPVIARPALNVLDPADVVMLTGLTGVGADAHAHADPLGPLCVAERVVRTTAAVECVRSRSGVADGTVTIPVLQRVIAPRTVGWSWPPPPLSRSEP